ncbi:hypothetical protein VMCG_00179 [Cytospora schulzeri]|uniref:Uncharacterized protein n=1 Tax=Cytospora schulzeri TaxID=448051 RepID=A0A423X9D4_9PEZI|nr:hypothetical protein VMCG_00179 [Valsa malicola]
MACSGLAHAAPKFKGRGRLLWKYPRSSTSRSTSTPLATISRAKIYVDGLHFATPPVEDQLKQKQWLYEKWLRRAERDEGTIQADPEGSGVGEQQGELEAGFKGRLPYLDEERRDMDMSMIPSQIPPVPPGHSKDALYDFG